MISISIFLATISPYAAVMPVLLIPFWIIYKKVNIVNNPWNRGLFLLFIWSFLVGIVNRSTVSTAASFAILLYFFMSVYFESYDELKIEGIMKRLVVFSILSAFIGIVEKYYALFDRTLPLGYLLGIPSYLATYEDYRIYSTFGNPNVAGAWFAVMILICFYFYDDCVKNKKIFYGVLAVLFIAMLDLTGSRGAAIGLLFAIVTYALFKKTRENRGFLSFIFVSVLILMFIAPQLMPIINKLNNSMNHGLNYSIGTRHEIWESCFNMFLDKPVTGWGLMGIYYSNYDIFKYVKEFHGHNIWITLATTLGVVGLGIYFYMKYHLLQNIIGLSYRNCRLVPLLASIQALIIGHGLVDFAIMTPQIGIIFIGCSASICALAAQYNIDESTYRLARYRLLRKVFNGSSY